MRRLAKINVGRGRNFRLTDFDPEIQQAIKEVRLPVMAKYWTPGEVKTRLGAAIGERFQPACTAIS